MKRSVFSAITPRSVQILTVLLVCLATHLTLSPVASAFPVYAQQAYDSPREATGRIVCANCHLAAKPTQVEVPQAVLPDTVFEAIVKIPYDREVQQVLVNDAKGPLNVGAVLMLPEGFKIAPPERIPEEIKEETTGLFYQSYKPETENVVVVGPVPGDQFQEIIFPVLSPDPATDSNIHFGKYQIHVGGNRGRGQINPTGEKTNNNAITASAAGEVISMQAAEDGGYEVTIATNDGDVTETIPPNLELTVEQGQEVSSGQALTNDPNVGGFGQKDAEIVLQSPTRIKWLIAFFAAITLSQIMLVLKKKQIEKVQAAELNF